MCLAGGQGGQRGYAMAALLVSIGVMMVVMSVAMPVWRTQSQREKEAELVFRGEQIARSINLYMRKMGGGNYPPSLDVLVQGRFLRKKYKDPMTKDGEWDVILAAGGVPGQGGSAPQQPGRSGRGGAPSTGLNAPPSRNSSPSPSPFAGGQAAGGGIMGVRSKSKESSFRLYKGSGTHYNEWLFLFSSVSNRPGVPGGGQPVPGQPGRGGSPVPGIGPVMGPGGGRGPGRGPVTVPGPDGGRGPRGFGPGSMQPGIGRGGGG
jgi:type II secretory pathway pseudopilin PulG